MSDFVVRRPMSYRLTRKRLAVVALIAAAGAGSFGLSMAIAHSGHPFVAAASSASAPAPKCALPAVALLESHRAGGRVVVRGLARATLAGKPVVVEALVGGRQLDKAVRTKVGLDGRFSASLVLPPRSKRARTQYRASVGAQRSRQLRLVRKMLVQSRTSTAAGVRVSGVITGVPRRWELEIRRQRCTGSDRFKTIRTTPKGRFTVTFAKPPATDPVTLYRARAAFGRKQTYTEFLLATVPPVKHPLVATDDAQRTNEDTPLSFDAAVLLANDVDPGGGTLSVTEVHGDADVHGDVARSGSRVTYRPARDFHGQARFRYTVSDGQANSAQATVVVDVAPVQDPPFAVDDRASTGLNVPLEIVASQLLANDSDPDGDPLSITRVDGGADTHGTVALTGQTVTFTPLQGFAGATPFEYTISDGRGNSDQATVNVTVTPGHDPPVAGDDSVAAREDEARVIPAGDLLQNDSDPDGDSLSVSAVSGGPGTHGTVALTDGRVTYSPAADFNGDASFQYTVSDAHGGEAHATVSIVVREVNDPPIADADSKGSASRAMSFPAIDLTANDSPGPANESGQTLSVTKVIPGPGTHGGVTLNLGTVAYIPVPGFVGNATFAYEVCDDGSTAGAPDPRCAAGDVTIAVGETAPPVAEDLEIATDEDAAAAVTLAATAETDDPLTYAIVAAPQHGTLAPSGTGAAARTYTPDADFSGSDRFTYKASDGSRDSNTATVTVTVRPLQDAPTARPDTTSTDENISRSIDPADVLANDSDPDHDDLTVTSVASTPDTHGAVALGSGRIVYSPPRGFAGSDEFEYRISDGHGGTAKATVAVTVTAAAGPADCTDHPGGVFVTGHDPDFHATSAGNESGARNILKRAVSFVTGGAPGPRILLVTGLADQGSDHRDPRLGLTAAGMTFDVADAGGVSPIALSSVDFDDYDAVVVASDNGGWLRQQELDVLVARRAAVQAFVNGGGGLVALAENGATDGLTVRDQFAFLPFLAHAAALGQDETNNTVSPFGLSLGLTTDDVNGNFSHNVFEAGSGLEVVDRDGAQRIVSLAERGRCVGDAGVQPKISIDDASVAEGDDGTRDVAATVRLSNPYLRPVSAQFATADDTAAAGSDYVATSGTVTIPAGDTTATIRVPVAGDLQPESDETFRVTLSAPVEASLDDAGATVTIVDDDVAPGCTDHPGGIFVTGHDPDVHAITGTFAEGARNILRRAIAYVTGGKPSPRVLLVTGLADQGPDHGDPRIGLSAAGFDADVADADDTGPHGLAAVDFEAYDVVVVASDHGGWLRQSELDLLNARRRGVQAFINRGGGVVALAEGAPFYGLTTRDWFAFLPFVVASQGLNQSESGNTLTPLGVALGLTTDDINGNYSHNIFLPGSGLGVVDLDPAQEIMSLAARGRCVGDGGVQPGISVGDVSVAEGDDEHDVAVTATLSNAHSRPITAHFATSDGTADAGSDYAATSGTVTFSAGETTATIDVPILGDKRSESDETFRVTLTAPGGATLDDAEATVTIVDDDTPPGCTDHPGGVFVTGHDPDYHANSGNSEGARNIIRRSIAFVTHGKASPHVLLVTGLVDHGVHFLDSRNGLSSAGFTFDVADAGGRSPIAVSSVRFTDYDVVVVASDFGGWLNQEELDGLIARRHDLQAYVNGGGGLVALAEGDPTRGQTTHDRFGFVPFVVGSVGHEQVEENYAVTPFGASLGLSNGDINGSVSHNILLPGSGLRAVDVDGGGSILSLAERGQCISDDGLQPEISIADTRIDEGDSDTHDATVTATLSGPYSRPVTAHFETSDGTAAAGSDYDATSGTVTFPAGETTATIHVPVRGDLRPELDETLHVTLSAPAESTLANAEATVTIVDDDAAPGCTDHAGGVFLTGHDPDAHGSLTYGDPEGARNVLRRATEFVTSGKASPRMLLVTSRYVYDPGGYYHDPALGLAAAGFSFDIADAGGLSPISLMSVDFAAYDVVVVASDYGGWLQQSELDLLIARRKSLQAFVNGGGGLVALAEGAPGDGLTTHGQFAFLPFVTGSQGLSQAEAGSTVTAFGASMGLTDGDVAGNASHNIFLPGSGLRVVDVDARGEILSLAERGRCVGDAGVQPEISIADTSVTEGDSGDHDASVVATLSHPYALPVSARFATSDGTAQSAIAATAPATVFDETFEGETCGLNRSSLLQFRVLENNVHVLGGDCGVFDTGDHLHAVDLDGSATSSTIETKQVFPPGVYDLSFDLAGHPARASTVIVSFGAFSRQIEKARVAPWSSYSETRVELHAPSALRFTVPPEGDAGPTLDNVHVARYPSGIDYRARTGVVTIPAGETTATIGVPVVGDEDAESDETFAVKLSAPANATLRGESATVTIADDDQQSAPVAHDDVALTPQDTPVMIPVSALLANDTDVDGDQLAVGGVAATADTRGTVTLMGSAVRYVPDAGFNGDASFEYTVADGHGGSAHATVSVTVQPFAPVPSDCAMHLGFDTLPSAQGWRYEVDNHEATEERIYAADGYALQQDSMGVVQTGLGDAFYTRSDVDVARPFRISMRARVAQSDGPLFYGFSTGVQTGSEDLSFGVTTDGVYDATSQLVLALDATRFHDYVMEGRSGHGFHLFVDGQDTGTLASRPYQSASHLFLGDGTGGGNARATVTSYCFEELGNHAPVAANDAVVAGADEPLVVQGADLVANDSDRDGDALAVSAVHAGADTHGTVELSEGAITYTSEPGFTGSASFTYTVCDDGTSGGDPDPRCDDATVNVEVVVAGSPRAEAVAVTTDEDDPHAVELSASDPDGDPLTYSIVTAPANGAITPAGDGAAARTYTPDPDSNGTDHFTYRANDGTRNSNTATVTVAVREVNDAPAATADARTIEGRADSFPAAFLTSNDAAGPANENAQTLTVSKVTASPDTHGEVTLSLGTVHYTADPGYLGDATFGYEVCDDGTSLGAADPRCADGVATITVRQAPVAPVADDVAITTDEGAAKELMLSATDASGDPLTYAIVRPPAHGTVFVGGAGGPERTYTPDEQFFGTDSFTYRASDATASSNIATVTVTVRSVNDAPFAANDAKDAERDIPLTFPAADLLANDDAGPDNESAQTLTIASVTPGADTHGTVVLAGGAITYTPTAGYLGDASFDYHVCDNGQTAGDPDPRCADATVQITVAVPAPRHLSVTPGSRTIAGGETVGYTARGTFADGSSRDVTADVTWTSSVPAIANVTDAGVARGGSPGDTTITAKEGDVTATAALTVTAPTLRSIVVEPADPTLLVGDAQPFDATGVLSDGTSEPLNGLVGWTSSNGPPASIDAGGTATALASGSTTITATRDGISGSTTITVNARADADTTDPIAEITAPADGAEITEPSDVVGTATDPNLEKWTLQVAPAGDTSFTTIAQSTDPVTSGTLGRLDPTMLVNDQYTVLLTVYDRGGNTTTASTTVQVTRDMKVGNFSLTFKDLEVPLAGIPITVNRVYDSRDKTVGDFGVGWRLDVQTMRIRTNRVQGAGWQVNKTGSPFFPTWTLVPRGEHKVSVTLPDGHVEEFDLAPDPSRSVFYPFEFVAPTYQPRSGTLGTLQALDLSQLIVRGDQPGLVSLIDDTDFISVADPQVFQYTAADGTAYVIDKRTGVRSVTDTNGNSLTFSRDGILHSSGVGVRFTRDALGRITTITDPMGNEQHYAYDANGNLASRTDPSGNRTAFAYNRSHGLLEIRDPRGYQVARNEYDDDGRLVAMVDAAGHRTTYEHDVTGRQEIVRDRRGNATVYEYDDDGNLLRETDPVGGTVSRTYDSRGNELTVTDQRGDTTTSEYDARNNVVRRTDPAGGVVTSTYNARNQILSHVDARGHTTTYSYDVDGNPLSTTDPGGGVVEQAYGFRGLMSSTTDATGNVTRFDYDHDGALIGETDPAGAVTTYTHDPNGNRTSRTQTRTDEDGATVNVVTQMSYDAQNREIEVIDAEGGVTRAEYDPGGRVAATVDGNGGRTSMVYDAVGRLTTTTFPDGTTHESSYDAGGNRIATTDQDGRVMHYDFDATNRVAAITGPDGSTSTADYDATGRPAALVDARGNRSTFEYDGNGRLSRAVDARGAVRSYAYDANGNKVREVDARGHATTLAYDSTDQLTSTTFPDDTTRSTVYDRAGRAVAQIDEAGAQTKFDYDTAGRMDAVIDALGETTTYEHDELGKRTKITNARGNVTRLAYDNVGNLVRRTLPLGQHETFGYDADANQISHTDFSGTHIVNRYDDMNRLAREERPDGTTTRTYTPSGMAAVIDNPSGQTRYEYDDLDRVIRVVDPDGAVLRYGYDANGNRSSLESDAGRIGYSHDAVGNLVDVTDPEGGVTRYGYDLAGNQISESLPNATREERAYDDRNRLVGIRQLRTDDSVIGSYAYTLSPTGQRTGVQEHGGRSVGYRYDALSRLVEEDVTRSGAPDTRTSYTYDAVGNRLTDDTGAATTSSTYDANDQLRTRGNTSYDYDADGNLVRRSGDAGSQAFVYDSMNRLRGTTAAGASAQFRYDAAGNRVASTVGASTTRFVLDAAGPLSHVVEEHGSDGSPAAGYVYGNELISQTRAGQTSFYHPDAAGSTRALTDASANITDTYTYDAFGNDLGSTGSTTNDMRFDGEQLEPQLGTYNLRARHYDPSVGRFVTADPLSMPHPQEPQLTHRYLYAAGDPVNRTDRTGLDPDLLSLGIGLDIASGLATLANSSFVTKGPDCDESGLQLNHHAIGGLLNVNIGFVQIIFGVSNLAFGTPLNPLGWYLLVSGVARVYGGVQQFMGAVKDPVEPCRSLGDYTSDVLWDLVPFGDAIRAWANERRADPNTLPPEVPYDWYVNYYIAFGGG